MRVLMLLVVVAMMSGCGNDSACEGVDTSQAPTSIIRNGSSTTYYWGDCSRTYFND